MSESEFRSTLASRFSSIGDVASLSRDEPRTAFSRSDLSAVIGRPTFERPLRPLPFDPPREIQPLTPVDADRFISRVAQTPEEAIAAAVHAARTAFEAIPTAQNGDVIDASIPNGFRSALITLLSLADATVQQIVQRQPPTRPDPRPPAPPGRPAPDPPGPLPPREQPPIAVTPPIRADPGVVNVPPPAFDPGGLVRELPAIAVGDRIFEASTVTHPETNVRTTVFVERADIGVTPVALAPVAGGGFHLRAPGGIG